MSIVHCETPGGISIDLVVAAYARQFMKFGACHTGVLWSSADIQIAHFRDLAGIVRQRDADRPITINDLGCGYGAFYDFLTGKTDLRIAHYNGYDICAQMIAEARQRLDGQPATFCEAGKALKRADYSFASGTFNLKATTPDEEWVCYVKQALLDLWSQSERGMAFNLLDHARQPDPQPWLYYADIGDIERFCRTAISANVRRIDSTCSSGATLLLHR